MVKRQMKRGNCGQCVRTAPVCTGFEDAQPCLNPAYCSLSKALRRAEVLSSPRISYEIGETSAPLSKLQPGMAIAIRGTSLYY